MTPAEALRRFEQKLVSARTIAASEQAFDKYEKEWMPLPSEMTHQGFTAGYDAAMDAVRAVLVGVQNEVLRASPLCDGAPRVIRGGELVAPCGRAYPHGAHGHIPSDDPYVEELTAGGSE